MLAHIASLILLAFAVSLDGFGVGITYGIRKIKIPALSVAIISICSGLVILLAMLVGVTFLNWMSPTGASRIGAVILIGIGLWALVRFIRQRKLERAGLEAEQLQDHAEVDREPKPIVSLELRVFGIIIQILRSPSAADIDRSGIISAGEALLLGMALSLDAFGAGIGAALVGFPPITTAILIAVSSGSFLWLGTRFGFWVSGWRFVKQLLLLPGIILIVMGVFKLL
ncbi:MAG: sporulation membrane protein YtaF [Candidatus Cohnella colombiensis]|uniref:Sporulation membrane protein YtaF n=1 Tax=Candidatus Cohnella colombiensis TaxID=3121368 RepID=A0AA95JBT2_9BACL|nr:MAG: sporulation membrane protein YtaF [Cohnella sp.]